MTPSPSVPQNFQTGFSEETDRDSDDEFATADCHDLPATTVTHVNLDMQPPMAASFTPDFTTPSNDGAALSPETPKVTPTFGPSWFDPSDALKIRQAKAVLQVGPDIPHVSYSVIV